MVRAGPAATGGSESARGLSSQALRMVLLVLRMRPARLSTRQRSIAARAWGVPRVIRSAGSTMQRDQAAA